jgi:hypothetical protein
MRPSRWALLLRLALASPTLAGSTRCLTYEEKTMQRLQTLCDDGTRAVSTDNRTLERWDTVVTPPATSPEWKIYRSLKTPRR